jgi:hypothetical protein
MSETELLGQFVGTVGFPIATAIYLMYKDQKDKERWSKIVENNTSVMAKVTEVIRKCEGKI